jgi:hypothetical protein
MYKLCFFVPESHLETVKEAIFEAGAGRIGDYDRCCWQVLGDGQFRPLPGSQPFSGKQGELERARSTAWKWSAPMKRSPRPWRR